MVNINVGRGATYIPMLMRYATVKKYDVANGPGVRVSLYTQGCPHHCPGCFNPETWEFDAGNVLTAEIMDTIIEQGKSQFISGLSILGGEPFAQNLTILNDIITRFKKETGKTVWVWTGYLYEDLIKNPGAKEVLDNIDVLVDGPFIESEKDLTLIYRGSRNQRVLKLDGYKVIDISTECHH